MSIAEKLTTIAENEQKVYDAGRTQEWSDFWDDFQQNGNRTNYRNAFGSDINGGIVWTDRMFRPKYDLKVKQASAMFGKSTIKNIKQSLIDCGVSLIDNAASLYYTFFESSTTHIPDLSNKAKTNIQNAFNAATNLVWIDGIRVAENCQCQNAFNNCIALEHVIFYGTIGTIGLNLKWSTKLDSESIESIIAALSDTTTSLTITLPTTAKATYYNAHSNEYADEETAWSALIGTKSNWTISLMQS